MTKHFRNWVFTGIVVGLLASCGTSTTKVAMRPSKTMLRDVFACKGLTADNRWVGVTDQFMPETDPRVVVVAQLLPEDLESRIHYEFVNPLDTIVFVEEFDSPEHNPLGIYVEMSRFMDLGGEGQWTANIFSNGQAIGQTKFYIGEKPKDEMEDTGYFVVGADETGEEDEMEQLQNKPVGSYIQEVTPELDIPQNQRPNMNPAPGALENATNNEPVPSTQMTDEFPSEGMWIDENSGSQNEMAPQPK